MKKLYEDDPIKAAEDPAYYYYQIMNILDTIALDRREPTKEEIDALDYLNSKDGGEIEDIADANDCYTEDDELCSTWEEMVVALRELFECGDRVFFTEFAHEREMKLFGKSYLAEAQAYMRTGAVYQIDNFGDNPNDINIEIQREGNSFWVIIDDNRDQDNLMRGNAEFSRGEFLTMTREEFDEIINYVLENDMFPDPE